MALETYRAKRNFKRTPEPKGKAASKKGRGLRFVIQKHDATRLHYDFRLELDGVLKSWAVPKGPSFDPGRKSLAVQVEDHPIEYGDFEGVIPKGEYGGGTVMLWDRGTWEPVGDARDGLNHGKLVFNLDGEKLHGEWTLVRMGGKAGGGGKNWLLMKHKDEHANPRGDITSDAPNSVKTGRSLEQIAGDRDDVWSGDARKAAKIAGAEKSALPKDLSPQLAVLVEQTPGGNEWLHEIKFDGYRLLGFIHSGTVKLITRNGKDWTSKFASVAKAMEKLKVDSAIVDGEVVVLDAQGRSDFQGLQAMLKDKQRAQPFLYIFDMPFCDGVDLRKTPLIERKKLLERLLRKSRLPDRIQYSDHVIGKGEEMAARACRMGLEGLISKRVDSPYVSRREPTWVKSKCGQRQEFIIIGFTDPQGARKSFGSLLLGYHDENKRLLYAGRVGTGFDERLLGDIHDQLARITQKAPPTDVPPPPRERREAHWVRPQLVAEVRFTGWTRDDVLRHPAFMGLRADKRPSQITREVPMKPQNVEPLARAAGRRGATRAAKSESSADGSLAGVRLTHPDKVLYPEQGVTKRDLAEYYQQMQTWMLPHVIGRPLALVRCPDGRASQCFFQRNWAQTLPPAVGKVNVSIGKRREMHVAVNDLAGVISMVQVGVLEIHLWNCRNDRVDRPDQLVFDLDPGPGVSWKQVIEGARVLNRTLADLGLPTFLKTSGGKGLHLTIPIQPNIDWDSAKSFCATIAQSLAQQSDRFVTNIRKDLRPGKILIDYHRNGRGATAVAPYSSRAREGAPVSMPITWQQLAKVTSPAQFTVKNGAAYLKKRKTDPWRDFERSRVDLRKLVQRKAAA